MSSCSSAPQQHYSSSVIVQRRAHYLSHHSHSLTGPFSWEIKACCLSGRRAASQHKLRLMTPARKSKMELIFRICVFEAFLSRHERRKNQEVRHMKVQPLRQSVAATVRQKYSLSVALIFEEVPIKTFSLKKNCFKMPIKTC